jgi:DNA-directed RNA polymerase specialized sigma24 family protein
MTADLPDDVVSVATRTARRLGRKWGRDYGDYLGACWRGASAAAAKELAGYAMVQAGVWEVSKELRVELRHRPEGTADSRHDFRLADPERDALAAWGETAAARRGMHPRVRVWMYLIGVEGWTRAEIRAAWGTTENAVNVSIQRARNGKTR